MVQSILQPFIVLKSKRHLLTHNVTQQVSSKNSDSQLSGVSLPCIDWNYWMGYTEERRRADGKVKREGGKLDN